MPAATMACSSTEEDDGASSDAVTNKTLDDIGQALGRATSSEVLTKNEDGLAAKLGVIDGAKAGDTLDISYYIFSDDESSALFATRLVEAAKRGVKIRVIVDYLTNFTRYHYFKAIQDAAGGPEKIQFKFYNKPNANILEDVKFLVTPCPTEKSISDCTAERRANVNSAQSQADAKLFLSGLYSKNGGALQASLGKVIAQFQKEQASSPPASAEDKAKALGGLKLLFDAKVKGDVSAMLIVLLAGEKLAPLHKVWAALIPQAADEHARDWQHLTDFTHQKITLRTSRDGSAEVVVGGRNVENSYHLSDLPAEAGDAWRKKYIFMDVDLHASFASGAKIRERFEKVWGFDTMAATMRGDVEKLTPVDLQIPAIENGAPVEGKFVPVLQPYTYEQIAATAARFREYGDYDGKGKIKVTYRGAAVDLAERGQFPRFDASEDPKAEYYYFDNVHNPIGKRVFGSDLKFGQEKEGGKEIQELWIRALKDVCKNGDGHGNKVEIVFHNAYLNLPGRMQLELFERTDLLGHGTSFECEKGVSKVRILTNSRESTDLNVVNVYNEAWMKPTLEVDRGNRSDFFISYREYKTNHTSERNPIARSLHAKVMIFGNDIFIGSANADGRSQFMDLNNGIFIRNAPKLTAAYRAWLTNVIEPDLTLAEDDPRRLRSRKIEEIAADNAKFMGNMVKARGHGDIADRVEKRIVSDSLQIYGTASKCLQDFDKKCLAGIDVLLQPF